MLNKICILADKHDWHTSVLRTSLKNKNLESVEARFSDFSFKIDGSKLLIYFQEKICNFDGIWVRYINGGNIEEITYKLSILHLLTISGIYVHNSADVIEKTIDKFRTSSLLAINNIPTPKTFIKTLKTDSKNNFLGFLKNSPFLHKPVLGSQGKGIIIFKEESEFNVKKIPNHVLYVQKFIGNFQDDEFKDIRVLISNHRILACVERISDNFITNASRGGIIKEIHPDKKIRKIAKKISTLFKLGYGGLDLKFYDNTYYVLEINSIPSWKATQKVIEKNISDMLIEDFLEICINEKKQNSTLS